MNNAIAHPRAPAAPCAGEPPRYLVRYDGMVLDYHPALARLGTFEPAQELPDWHLLGIEAAAQREARRQELLRARQVAQAASAAAPENDPAAESGAVPRRRLRGGAR